VLGTTAGNALEMREAIGFLTGQAREPRLLEVTLALAAQMLELSGLAPNPVDAEAQARKALASGAAAERFARMVAGLGGPKNLLAPDFAGLAQAPVVIDVLASRDGFIAAMDTRAIGVAVIALGGGRLHADDAIDPRVGFSDLRCVGARLQRGESLGRVHARSQADAAVAGERLITALRIDEKPPPATPTVLWSSARG